MAAWLYRQLGFNRDMTTQQPICFCPPSHTRPVPREGGHPAPDTPFCLARLKTLMSLSCTPIPVRRDTDSVALSLLPLLMEPFAWVLRKQRVTQRPTQGPPSSTRFCHPPSTAGALGFHTYRSSKYTPRRPTPRTCPCCCWTGRPLGFHPSPGRFVQSCPSGRRTSKASRPEAMGKHPRQRRSSTVTPSPPPATLRNPPRAGEESPGPWGRQLRPQRRRDPWDPCGPRVAPARPRPPGRRPHLVVDRYPIGPTDADVHQHHPLRPVQARAFDAGVLSPLRPEQIPAGDSRDVTTGLASRSIFGAFGHGTNTSPHHPSTPGPQPRACPLVWQETRESFSPACKLGVPGTCSPPTNGLSALLPALSHPFSGWTVMARGLSSPCEMTT